MRPLRAFAVRNYLTLGLCAIALIAFLASGLRPAAGSLYVSPIGEDETRLLPTLPDSDATALTLTPGVRASGEKRSNPLELKLLPASMVRPFAASLTATKTDNTSSPVDPGATIMYTIEITNTGDAAATNVMLTDTLDPNVTLVPGTVKVAPIAVNDNYNTIGNVNLVIPVAQGVIQSNDLNPNGGGLSTLSVTQVNATVVPAAGSATAATTLLGSVTMFSDGHFDYTPKAGVTGNDTFTYTLSNSDTPGKTDTATVTIAVNDLIWFVNSAAAAGGDGRLTTPFNLLSSAAAVDTSSDAIFLYTSGTNYTGGITLESSEFLIGQGASQSILTITGFLTPSGTNQLPATGNATDPLITTAGTVAITLGSNNKLHGFTVGDTGAAGTDISGSAFGTVLIKDVSVKGTGRALNLFTSGTITAGSTFDLIETTGGDNNEGVRLNGIGGSFTATATNIVNPALAGIDVQSAPAGTSFSFGTTTVSKTLSGTGVNLASNSGTFSFSSLAVTTSAGTGVSATSSGTVNVSGGSISATGGPALVVNPTTIGMTFASVTSSASTTKGISLTSVTGVSAANCLTISTTTITNAAQEGILVQSLAANSPVSFGATSITNPDGDTTGGTGVSLIDNVGNVSFGDLDITPETNQRAFQATNAVANSGSITTTSGTIAATGAIAFDVSRTSAGTIPLTISLTSVSASGGTNGIRLNNTSGSFTVVGGGGSCTSVATCTGGAIQNTTGDGISLNNVQNVSLTRMIIKDTGGNGILGTTVTGLTMAGCRVEGAGDAAGEHGVSITNLFGTSSVTGSTFIDSAESHLKVRNTTATVNAPAPPQDILTVSNSSFNFTGGAFVGDNIQYSTETTANARFIVNNTGGGVTISGPVGIAGVQCNASSGSRLDVHVSGVTRGAGGPGTGGTGTGINMNPTGPDTFLTYHINNNNISNANTSPINATVIAAGATTAHPAKTEGTIDSNTLNVGPTGNGITVIGEGNAQTGSTIGTITISNNNVSNVGNGNGIHVQARVGSTQNLTISNNTVNINDPLNLEGISVESGSSGAGDNFNSICLNMLNNKASSNGVQEDYLLRVRGTNIFQLQNFAGSGTSVTDITNWVTTTKNNKKADGVTTPTVQVSLTGASFSTSSGCTVSAFSDGPVISSTQPVSDAPNDVGEAGRTLYVAHGEVSRDNNARKLSQQELAYIVNAAIARWRDTGIAPEDLARLEAVSFEIADLPIGQLATAGPTVIKIDEIAAGYGWYLDEFPLEDSEFQVLVPNRELQTTDLSPAHGKMDLLTVVMRQFGQVYLQGKDRIPNKLRKNIQPLMEGTLSPSVRRLPLDQWRVTPTTRGAIKPSTEGRLLANSSTITLPGETQMSTEAEARYGQANGRTSTVSSEVAGDVHPALFKVSADVATGSYQRIAKRMNYAAKPRPAAARPMFADMVNLGPFTIPVGEKIVIMFSATVNALNTLPVGTSQVCNQGTVSATGIPAFTTDDPDVAGSNNPTCTKLNVADLAVTKSDTPDPVIAGNNITYTVNFVNNGPASASTVTVTDAVPANTTFVSAVVTTGTGWTVPSPPAVGGTGNIVFSKGTVASGETAVFTIVVKVTDTTPHLTVINNSVTAASTTSDTTPANNTASTTTTVTGKADLTMTKTASPTPDVVAGNDITYTLNFSNAGPGTAVNVLVSDAVPANTTLVSAVVTTGTGWTRSDSVPAGGTGTITFTKASVASGETAVFTIVVNVAGSVTPGTTITNTATATAATSDPTPATSTTNTNVIAQADLAVTKTDSPDPVTAGNNITYTINFVNNGPGTAQTVTVTDAVPTNTTFVSAVVTTGTGWTIPSPPAVGGTGNVVFAKASVPNGDTAVFTIVVKVNANTPSGTTISNSATAASTTSDPTPGNNTGSATTTVQTRVDLAVTKSDTPDPVIAGNNITYTINFTNNGPSDAQTVTVTDAVPANTTLVSAVVSTGSGWSVSTAGPIVFSKATVTPLETAVFTIIVNVNTNTPNGTTITNTATTATTTTDTNPPNDSATATTTVQTQANLIVTKTDTPDPVSAGNNLTYTVTFTNGGPSDAQMVTVTDAVPANTTFVSAVVTTGGGWIPTTPAVGGTGNIIFAKPTVAFGEGAVFTIIVNVNSNTANGTTITNSAVAASATVDPTPGNNTGTATTTVNAQADLAVTKTDTPDPAFTGTNITYTINFVNNGPSDAQTVTVTDAVPTNTTFVSAVVTTGTGWTVSSPAVGGTGNIVFSKATVASEETAVFTVVVKVDLATPVGTIVTNSATAASTTTDPTPGNNTGTATTTISAQADLSVTKTDSPDPVLAGNNITYTVNFANAGPGAANTVTVTDAVPANATFVSAVVTTGTGWSIVMPSVGGTGNVVFSKASVAPAESAVFTIVVKVNANTPNGTTITNSAVAASTTADPVPSNNTGTATTTVNTQADVAVTKTDTPDPVLAGANITYTINFVNNGPSDAQNVVVTDNTPAGTTLVSAVVTTGSGWSVGGATTFSKATVAAGETAVFTIVVKVPSSTTAGTVINNQATVTTDTPDPTSGNNTSSTTTTVNVQADLQVTKTDSPDPVIAGNNLTYTINFANLGPSDAQTVAVSDAVPAGTTLVSAVVTIGGGWSTSLAGPIVFSKGTVTAGEMAVFTIVVTVNPSTAAGTVISNSATATSPTTDPTPGNNTGTATTVVAAQADLQVTKTDTPDPVNAGSNITYTVSFVNSGPSFAQTVTLTDAVPTNTTFVSAVVTTGTGWTLSSPAVGGTGNIVFSKSPVANGETATFTIVVKVNSNTAAGTITNSAIAASTTTDPIPANNTGTATTTVQVLSDVSITKTDSPDPVLAGNNLTYTINLINNGPSDATTVSVSDPIPAGTTLVSVTTPAGWSRTDSTPVGGTGTITFTKATVINGETAVFTIVVKVGANVPNGTTLTNTATETSTSTDGTPGNNSSTATTTVQTQADLLVTKSDSPDPVTAGTNLTYTINFTNNGPSDAQTVTITDAVPAGTTFVSGVVTTGTGWTVTSPAVGTTGNVVFSKGTVAAGETAVFTIVVNVNANVANGTTITNSAVAASTTTDPTPANNTGTATTTVQTRADLSVTKSDSPDPVFAGANLTYTINFSNLGASDAQTVTVTDAVPANTTFVSAVVTTGTGWTVTSPAVGGTGNVVFSKGTVAAGQSAVFTMVVKVNSGLASGSTISNSATATSTTTDPTPSNNTGTATTTVQVQADLVVTKSDSPDPVVASQNLTYTINFVNNGPSNAVTVSLSDALPANTTFVSTTTPAGWTRTDSTAVGGTGTITFTKATVTPGETAVVTIVVNVNINTPNNTVITNSATATSPTPDPTPANNTGTATTTVIAQADLAVTKTDAPDPACVNGNITYTINLIDNGPGPGINTTVTDPVPANTTFVSASVTSGSGWSTTSPAVGGTGNVVFSKASVANGETATFQMVVKVNSGTVHGTVIDNSVVAASSIPDPNTGNNTAMASTTVDPIAPIFTGGCPTAVSSAAQASCPFASAGTVNYTPPAASDNCPGVTVVCVPPSGSMFPTGTTTVTCTATDTAGNTATCSFPVTVFSLCVQDNSNPGNVVLVDATTGAYRFCCNGTLVASGTGTLNVRGCTVTINDSANNKIVLISIDGASMKGTASVKQGGTILCTITDKNLANNSCVCQ